MNRIALRALAFNLAVLSVLGTTTTVAQNAPRRSIEEIADGVYRAMNNFHGTVFMVTDEGIILADPLRPEFAEWLKAEFAERFGVPVRYVIYSHHHGDHASGGEVFADTAAFVGHANMLDHLAMPDAMTALTDVVGQESPYAALDVDGDGVISRAEGESIGPLMVFEDFDEDENGEIATWNISGAGPGVFRRVGVSGRDVFKTGETYTATIALARDGSNFGYIVSFVMPDGRQLDLWAQYEAEPQ